LEGTEQEEEDYRNRIVALKRELVVLKGEGVLRDSLDVSRRSDFEMLELLGE